MKNNLLALAAMSLLALGQSAALAATGEVTLSGSTWTGKVEWDPLESTCRHASLSIL